MSPRRVVILVAALLIGTLAVFGIIRYVGEVRDEAIADAVVETVWVVRSPIPRGTPAQEAMEQGWIAEDQIPLEYRPQAAISDPTVELEGQLVAIADLPPGQVVVTGNFVPTSVATTSIRDSLEERGLVTVTVSLDQVGGVAYLVRPGDRVNILRLYSALGEEEVTATEGEESGTILVSPEGNVIGESAERDYDPYPVDARYLYQAAEVLAVDKELPAGYGTSDEEDGAAAATGNPGLITLAVPPEVAQMVLSVDKDSLYLSLVPSDYVPRPLLPVDRSNKVLPGEDPERLTPYGPNGLVEGEEAEVAPEAEQAEQTEQAETENGQ